MSHADDRIPIPTNGHAPPLSEEPEALDDTGPDTPSVERRGPAIAASPAQLAVGMGIVASLILLVVGARRRRG